MSDTNPNLLDLEVMPGGVTFREAQRIMETTPPTDPDDGAAAAAAAKAKADADTLRKREDQEKRDQEKMDQEKGEKKEKFDADRENNNALSRLNGLLAKFGLTELGGSVWKTITSGMVDLQDPDALIFSLRDEPAYKRRFAANDARKAAGLPELDPGTYIAMENQYRGLLRANGLPAGWYDDKTDFEKWIEGDVSAEELNERIQYGYRAVADADPKVKAQMRELYGVNDGELAAYFLDPERTRPLLTTRERTRQAQSAKIAARGLEQGAIQLSAGEAEDLASRGITEDVASERFGMMKVQSGLYDEMLGEEALSRQQKLGATFGYDINALESLEQRRQKRLRHFQGGGQFTGTSGMTSGTIETGLGQAQ